MNLDQLIETAQCLQDQYGPIRILVQGVEPETYYCVIDLIVPIGKNYALLLTQLTDEQRAEIAAQQKSKWKGMV